VSSQFFTGIDVASVYAQVLDAVQNGASYWRAIRQAIG
jgi:hypothetical protein